MDDARTVDGWQQINAGVAFVSWSRLAHWDRRQLRFRPAIEDTFEAHQERVHPSYGRLLCWLTFSTGAEYLCKGVCLLRGISPYEGVRNVIRAPNYDENLESWINLVASKDDAAKEPGEFTKPLGRLAPSLLDIEELGENRNRVAASMMYLADAIRNRDAHRYVKDVRSAHFRAIPNLLVPSLNDLLALTDQRDLSERMEILGKISEAP